MTDMFNREVYFDSVRASLFSGKLSQQQVNGQNAMLAGWEKNYSSWDLRWLAYVLATTIHETANTMWPVTEYGSQSYLQGKPYWPYIGRGFVQLTWKDNYQKATDKLGLTGPDDLVNHPERALDLVIASDVIFRGMSEGWFTGKKLSQYFNATVNDPVNARRIVNGNDKDTLIAGYHNKFLTALKAAQVAPKPPEPVPPTEPDKEVLVAITVPVGVSVTVTVNGELIGN